MVYETCIHGIRNVCECSVRNAYTQSTKCLYIVYEMPKHVT